MTNDAPGQAELNQTLMEITRTLKAMDAAGSHGFDCRPQSLATMDAWASVGQPPAESLADIRADLGECRRCGLSRTRTNIVFGAGNPNARLVFVGEGPGYDEDQKGEPFVGAAGQLLMKILKAMQLSREKVYICNVIKCRPPKNRNPQPDEVHTCFPFLKRQLKAIRPDFICALGTFAAQTLLGSGLSISRLRGGFHEYKQVKVLPTFHPAFLLRNPERKRDVWEDMKKIMRAMEIEPVK